MSFISNAVLASALTVSLAIGVGWALKTTEAEAKTSILYCGSPGNCTAYPYKPHGGRGSICAKYSPCYLSSVARATRLLSLNSLLRRIRVV